MPIHKKECELCRSLNGEVFIRVYDSFHCFKDYAFIGDSLHIIIFDENHRFVEIDCEDYDGTIDFDCEVQNETR
jgi:hypothetical protein